jgi:MFS family permease
MLLFGAWGGLLADRFEKRRLLMVTQAVMAVPALGLFAICVAGVVAPWMVFVIVFARGAVNAVDNPTRQSFVIEMVGPDRVVNAVSLNSVIVHSARIVGPAIAGVLIATVGVEPCFAVNAASFGGMIAALALMDPAQLRAAPLAPRERGAIRAALRYVSRTRELAVPLGLMALVGTFGLNFQVIVPLLARFDFGGSAYAYAAMVCAMGVGSVLGALFTGARGRTGPGLIAAAALVFGLAAALAAGAPTLAAELGVLAVLGAAAVTFAASINSSLQLAVEPHMRGRVMALYSVVFLGSNPIGGPLVGWISQAYDPRLALALAAVAGVAAAWAATLSFTRIREGGAGGRDSDDASRFCPRSASPRLHTG